MLVTHTFHTLWCSKPMEPILGEKRMRHLIVWILLRQTPKPRKVSYNTQKEKSEKSSAYVNVPVKSLDPAVTVCQGQSGCQGSTEGQWWWEELRPGGPKKGEVVPGWRRGPKSRDPQRQQKSRAEAKARTWQQVCRQRLGLGAYTVVLTQHSQLVLSRNSSPLNSDFWSSRMISLFLPIILGHHLLSTRKAKVFLLEFKSDCVIPLLRIL